MDKTLQYFQLDFLQIFRLGRKMGVFSRKRKMPIEYPLDKKKIAQRAILTSCKEIINSKVDSKYFFSGKVSYNSIYYHSSYLARDTLQIATRELYNLNSDIISGKLSPSFEDASFISDLYAHYLILAPPYNLTFRFIVEPLRLGKNVFYTRGYQNLLTFLNTLETITSFLDDLRKVPEIRDRILNIPSEEQLTTSRIIPESIPVIIPESIPVVIPGTTVVSVYPPSAQSSFNNALNRWRETRGNG